MEAQQLSAQPYDLEGPPGSNESEPCKKEERELLYNEIKHMERNFHKSSQSKPAEWRLRKQRASAIEGKLLSLGQLALLSSSSMLTAVCGGIVQTPIRSTNWRTTLDESPMMFHMSPVSRAQLIGAKYENYTRVESGIKAVGQMLCLSVMDLDDIDTVNSFNSLKVSLVAIAFKSDRYTDLVCEYCKWLGKAAQAVLLKSLIPEPPLPVLMEGEHVLPFGGQCSFISKWIVQGRRSDPITLNEARACAQIGNTPRATPYPSKDQTIQSIKDTVSAIQSTYVPPSWAMDRYRKGLQAERTSLGVPKDKKTHVSLISSGSVESSNSQGGRAAHLVKNARIITDQPLNFESMGDLVGSKDQFRLEYINRITWELAKVLLARNVYTLVPTLGHILYVKADQLELYWAKALTANAVPKELGNILNMTASKLITEIGYYDPSPVVKHGMLTWSEDQKPVFKMTGRLRVNADVSLESGMKTRVATAAMAAFAHLSQLPSNYMRSYLSNDPFARVGFQEADKLWETLKAYRKA